MEIRKRLKERLKERLKKDMLRVPELGKFCERCLRTERYGGNVVLMVVDAAFVSIGVNYFNVIVPAVLKFGELVRSKVGNLSEFLGLSDEILFYVWKNRRSWSVAKSIAEYLSSISEDDRTAIRGWASNSTLENWKEDSIGRIKGVGINTYQYLRMMGGIDTVMPDKIVKRYFLRLAEDFQLEVDTKDDLEFIKWVEGLARETGYKAIELCWLTWFVQYDERRLSAYRELMKII